MPTYTVHEAKTQLSKLIARRNTPAVRLVPITATVPKRRFGAYKGQATVTETFFEPLPEEELAAWEGQTHEPAGKKRRQT